jgi:hypothetical protein
LTNPEFPLEVEKIWKKPCRAKSPIDKIQQKLKMIKQYFKGWGFNLQGEIKKKRRYIQEEIGNLEELEETVGLLPNQISKKVDLLCENMNLLLQEESYWFNRSHEKWLRQVI